MIDVPGNSNVYPCTAVPGRWVDDRAMLVGAEVATELTKALAQEPGSQGQEGGKQLVFTEITTWAWAQGTPQEGGL